MLESGKSNDPRDSGFMNSDLKHQLLESHYLKEYSDLHFVKLLLLKPVKESLKTAPSVSYEPKSKKANNWPSYFHMVI